MVSNWHSSSVSCNDKNSLEQVTFIYSTWNGETVLIKLTDKFIKIIIFNI